MAAARALGPLLGPQTRILTLQNGIDSIGLIQAHVGATTVRGGVIYVSAVIDRPGVIRSPGGLSVIVADAGSGDPVMATFFDACARATALQAEPTDDIRSVLWEKFSALRALSATTSLLRAPMGAILAHPETRALQRQLVEEVMAKLAGMPASFRSSMSKDLARGKPLELNWLSGRVHALGQQPGVPTPAHNTFWRALLLYVDGKTGF
ncbi:hypothetical protein D621_11120 [beta proteobacterium AAP51]|nr:hypothetical protein D621_11120 [beta proteobacterium AAP51]